MITIQRYLTSDGKYPDREHSPELVLEFRVNAGKLIEAVNNLLRDLKINDVTISSGFRTQEANKAAGGSKFSAHCSCEAVDIVDKDKKLYNIFVCSIPALKKHGLYMEHGDYTATWVHLTTRRPKSGNRIFIPQSV